MTVGFRVGNIIDEIGTSDFLHAFFSTISHHLEQGGWGTQYPELMNDLYQGDLAACDAIKALSDIKSIREKLRAISPNEVVWDCSNLSVKPPWGNIISPDITDLSNYFVSSSGRDVFEITIECLEALASAGGKMSIVQI